MILLYVPESYVLKRKKGKGISLGGTSALLIVRSHMPKSYSLVNKLPNSPAEFMILNLYFPIWGLQHAAFDHQGQRDRGKVKIEVAAVFKRKRRIKHQSYSLNCDYENYWNQKELVVESSIICKLNTRRFRSVACIII